MKIPRVIQEIMAIMARNGGGSPEVQSALAQREDEIYMQLALMEYYRAVNVMAKKGQVYFV